jgi:hypothetical protein
MANRNENEILNKMVEIRFPRPDSFLVVKETLTRMGVASDDKKRLAQTCHILHKAGKYYITHFKLLFRLDGRSANIDAMDIGRQNTIATLLEQWGLVEIVSPISEDSLVPTKLIKIVSSKDKKQWELVPKHRIGRNQRPE